METIKINGMNQTIDDVDRYSLLNNCDASSLDIDEIKELVEAVLILEETKTFLTEELKGIKEDLEFNQEQFMSSLKVIEERVASLPDSEEAAVLLADLKEFINGDGGQKFGEF